MVIPWERCVGSSSHTATCSAAPAGVCVWGVCVEGGDKFNIQCI